MQIAEETEKRPLLEDLRELLTCPRELWLNYLALVVEYIGMYSFLQTLPLWLTSDFGQSDTQAGDWASYWSVILTLFVFFVGSIADSFGMRRTLIASLGAAAICRFLLSLVHSQTAAAAVLIAYGFTFATTSPVMQACVQRFSTPRTRAIAFALFYVSFNIGGVITGPVVDSTRKYFLNPVTHKLGTRVIDLPLLGPRSMSAHAAVMGIGALTSLLAFVIVLFTRKDAEQLGASPAAPGEPRKNPVTLFKAVITKKVFWRFVLLMVLLSMVRLLFQHMHFTWPKYVLRVNGDDFPAAKVWALNSLLILFLTPLATIVTRRVRALNVIIVGALITSASPFILCLGYSRSFQIAMVVTMTIGEALWSPRTYEYNVAIAPRGQESTYVGLAQFPYFLAKLIAARMSGRLLEHFCPASGARHPSILWVIIGLATIVGPLGILFLRKVIERKDEEEVPASEAVVAG
jgi:MFS family permease